MADAFVPVDGRAYLPPWLIKLAAGALLTFILSGAVAGLATDHKQSVDIAAAGVRIEGIGQDAVEVKQELRRINDKLDRLLEGQAAHTP